MTHAPHHAFKKKSQWWTSFDGIGPLGVQRNLSANAKKLVPFSYAQKQTFSQKEGEKNKMSASGLRENRWFAWGELVVC